MMGVFIEGMEMPKRCLDCPFMVSIDNDDCVLQTEVKNELARTWEELKASCPLVEIPTPHGRLGDLDALQEQIKLSVQDAHMSVLWKQGMAYAHGLIEASKTIIEAEGREKE